MIDASETSRVLWQHYALHLGQSGWRAEVFLASYLEKAELDPIYEASARAAESLFLFALLDLFDSPFACCARAVYWDAQTRHAQGCTTRMFVEDEEHGWVDAGSSNVRLCSDLMLAYELATPHVLRATRCHLPTWALQNMCDYGGKLGLRRISLNETCTFPLPQPLHTMNGSLRMEGASTSQAFRNRIRGASRGEPKTPRRTSLATLSNLHSHVASAPDSIRYSTALSSAIQASTTTTSQSPLCSSLLPAVYSPNSSKRMDLRKSREGLMIIDQVATRSRIPSSRSMSNVRSPKKMERTSWRSWRQVLASAGC